MTAAARRPLLLLLALLLVATVPATAWEGRLVGPDGAPLAGARVTPIGGSGGVLTDAEGRFHLPGEPDGTAALLVERADGALAVVELPDRRDAGALVVEVPRFRHQSVRVSAGAAGQLFAPPASPTSSFGERDLRARGDRSAQQLVAALPGTDRAHEDPDRVPSLRGMGQGRTLLLLDGAPLDSERRAGVSGGIYDTASWGGLDVVRGPASVAYGSAAMAGALLVKSPWAAPGASRRVEIDLGGDLGDAPAAGAALRWREAGWALAAAARGAGDPTSADGDPLEGEYRRRSLFVGRSVLLSDGLLRAGFRSDSLAGADRLAARDPARLTRLPREHQERLVLNLERGQAIQSSFVLWAAAGRRTIEQRRSFDIRATTSEQDLGARLTLRGDAGAGWWLAGTELRWRRGIETEVEVAGDPQQRSTPLAGGRQRSIALFARLSQPLGRSWTAGAGLRVEPIRSRALSLGVPLARGTTAVAGTLSLARRFGGAHAVVLQLARGFREPRLSERYYEGITGRGLLQPNRALDREVSRQLDLLWRWGGASRHLELAAYEARIDDVIVRRLIAPGGPGALDTYRFENAGTGRIRGLELDAGFRLGRAGTIALAAHRIVGRDGGGAALDGIPATGGRITWERATPRGALRAVLDARAAKRDPGPGEQPIPGWGRVDLGADWRLARGWTLTAAIANLLDQPLVSSAERRAPVAPGRTLRLGLTWRAGAED